MSGSTIGGFAGAAIGFMFGGPAGAQWGFMIGSAVGGYVDPPKIEGPRLTDAQTQTSNEGVPRPIVYGTAAVAGNIIQRGPLVEHKKTERASKGGPKTTTYTYTRTIAIRISEAAPLGGTMRLVRVWDADKLVADFSPANTIPADTAAFASKLTFYSGGETQLPDPSLEALPVANGGGVGNVPSYRGTCYAVLTDLDCTDRQGAVPQFRWEVASDAVEAALPAPTIGAQTASVSIGGSEACAYIDYATVGVRYGRATDALAVGANFTQGSYDNSLAIAASSLVANAGDGPESDDRVWMRAYRGQWAISAHGNFGRMMLLRNGEYVADLRPTTDTVKGWWYGESLYSPAYGTMLWFVDDSTFVAGVRKTNNTVWNRIYKWRLRDASGETIAADSTSPPVTTDGSNVFFVHADRGGTVRAIAFTEAAFITYAADLSEISRETLPMAVSGLRAFAVDSGMLILYRNSTLYFYDLDTFTLQTSIGVTTVSSVNNQLICSDDSIYVKNGVNLRRVSYAPTCYASAPAGWYSLPDTPNVFTDGVNYMPRCGAPTVSITAGMVSLAAIVADLCARGDVAADQVDVSALAGISVRGYPVGRQTSPAEAIKPLQDVFDFDFPEWGNSGDTTTKLRAVLRGGAITVAITDDDLVDNEEDDDGTRPQQVEFPRKVSLTFADPDANYEPATQPAERTTENVKAIGETQISTSVVLTRAEAAVVADKLLKRLWEEANGRISRELPEEFSRYTASDRVSYAGKRWRIERTERTEGTNRWDMVRDRASAAASTATGSPAPTPSPPVSSTRGPTMFGAWNLPRLRSQDTTPGMYVGVAGLLPGWAGCDLYLSVDDGVTEQLVGTFLDAATMGTLSADLAAVGTTASVSLYGGELDSATVDQLLARQNAAAVTTAEVSEILQFQTATDTGDKAYDLTDLSHGVFGTAAAQHYAGDSFVLLDGAVSFIPLDISLAGKPLIFRPVSIGTAPANNPTYSVTFKPKFTGPQVVEAYVDDLGATYVDENGYPYYASEV